MLFRSSRYDQRILGGERRLSLPLDSGALPPESEDLEVPVADFKV